MLPGNKGRPEAETFQGTRPARRTRVRRRGAFADRGAVQMSTGWETAVDDPRERPNRRNSDRGVGRALGAGEILPRLPKVRKGFWRSYRSRRRSLSRSVPPGGRPKPPSRVPAQSVRPIDSAPKPHGARAFGLRKEKKLHRYAMQLLFFHLSETHHDGTSS